MENRFVKCANYISYTWQHKKAFLRVEKQCRGFNSLRGYFTTLTSYFATWLFCGSEKTGRFKRLIERLPVIMPSTRGIRIPRRIIC